jgi:MFS family permease
MRVWREEAGTKPEGKMMSDQTLCTSPPKPVSGWFMALYAFTQYAHWLAILTPVTITIALRIGQIATPDQKGASLATIMSIGAFCAMIAAPIWGAISDNTRARIGRRKFWIVAGSLFLLAGLSIMALSQSLWLFGAGWIICQIGSNAAQASINAIQPDQVPLEQGKQQGISDISNQYQQQKPRKRGHGR